MNQLNIYLQNITNLQAFNTIFWFALVVLYGISILVGYLMRNSVCVCVCVWYTHIHLYAES